MGIHRNQFTFYASFLAAAEQLPPKLRSEFLLILCRYALDEIEPETRSSTVKTAFELVRPVLDKARRKAMAGKSGGEASGEIRSKLEANRSKTKQTGSGPEAEETALYSEGEEEKEKEKEKEYEYEGEEEGGAPPMRADHEAFSPVLDALARIGEKVSDKMETDVGRICAEYGTKAVLQAIERAEAQEAPRWSYIRAIVTSGGVRQGKKGRHIIGHGDPPSPAMLQACREMLKEPEEPNEAEDRGFPGGAALDWADELLPEAVEICLELGKCQTSILQRRLQIGYARAARIIDEMEEHGIVGPFIVAAPREVLISPEEWEIMKQGTDPSLQAE